MDEVSIQYGKGIGPKRGAALQEIGINTIEDLFNYFPFDYLDRSRIIPIANLPQFVGKGIEVTIIGKVCRHELKRTRNGRKLFFLTLEDDSGFVTSIFFAGFQWYQKMFPIGKVVAASAFPEIDQYNKLVFIHPEFDRLSSFESIDDDDTTNWEELIHTGKLVPKYRCSEKLRNVGLDSRGFRKIIHSALSNFSQKLIETLNPEICTKRNLIGLKEAINEIHFPTTKDKQQQAEQRLKYEELFYFQLMILNRKRARKEKLNGLECKLESKINKKFIDSLPFQLTSSQEKCITEIINDLRQQYSMNRLLQGDVGSGKTVVAIAAMIHAVANGMQCAIMVPTEILAEQHFQTLQKWLNAFSIKIDLLVGKQKKKNRLAVLQKLQEGEIDIVVGTHALIEENVKFKKLGLIVIDEQHRFGVAQRSLLTTKSEIQPHVLVMTATPIPRTLSMTLYGDLDISILSELPTNRKKIITGIRNSIDRNKIYSFIKKEISLGRQAFIVYPLIDESEKVDLKAARIEYESLSTNTFKDFKVGLLHGRLSSEEKESVMKSFKNREINILVTTTVVEVGIDIQNATVILIEHAERFGLSQLHQLRGRVGRGSDQSYCILIADYENQNKNKKEVRKTSETQIEVEKVKKRLQALVESTDGFEIAQSDLEIRGQGDYFGFRQSGTPSFRIANIITDVNLLEQAHEDATKIILNNLLTSDQSFHEMKFQLEKKIRDQVAHTKI